MNYGNYAHNVNTFDDGRLLTMTTSLYYVHPHRFSGQTQNICDDKIQIMTIDIFYGINVSLHYKNCSNIIIHVVSL